MTELVGREREQLEVVERLATRRLVTVIGPAGIGKTALARAVADRVAPTAELGAHVVDLTRVDSSVAVAGAIAAQLGSSSFEALLSSPSDQPTLLLVDNCEHVITAAADAVAALLEASDSPTVLATSRSPLGVRGESLVVLGPLDVPAVGTDDVESDAVRLFVERARDAGTVIADHELPAVAELCRHLDGLPLAIELAAAQTRTMRPAEIVAHLGHDVDVLERPRFRGDHRHRSLAATIDWSYRLLPEQVAALFDRLGLFPGPFTADLVRAVGADVGLDGDRAAAALRTLVDSSLVVSEARAGSTRFRLLETVRTCAVRRLREQGALDEARRRLADHVVAAAAGISADGSRRWDLTTFARLLSLYDAVSSTLRWCLDHDDDGTRSLLLCSVLWGVVHQGHTDEVAALAEATIARWPDTSHPFAPDAVATAATARCILGDPLGAIDLSERTLPDATSSTTAPVTLRRAMAYAYRALGDRPTSIRLFEEVAELARERRRLALALEADLSRALLVADEDPDAALALALAARAEAAAAGSVVNEVWAASVAAHLRLSQDLAAGMVEVDGALAAARRIDYPAAISVNLRSFAWGSRRLGNRRAAASALLELFDGLLARSGVAEARGALFTTAELLHDVGSHAWAPLAATAQALPLIGLVGGTLEALELPPHGAAPLSRREAIVLARGELRRFLAGGPDEPLESTPAARTGARLVDRGAFWEISFAGRAMHAKASKGMSDLGRLVTSAGREIHCLDLMGAHVEQASTGEVIDQTARRRYEQRIRDLQTDVDEAEARNDYVRAERAQIELDAVVDHLTASLGLGGRSRGSVSSAERARSAVTQRIRSTIRRLGADHPELARHLEASVVTGTYCSYRPEHPVDWDLRA